MMEHLWKGIAIVSITLLLLIALVNGCNEQVEQKQRGQVIGRDTTAINTIVKTHVDTIQFIDSIPRYYKIPKTVLVPITIDHGDYMINIYHATISDSLIEGVIHTKIRIDSATIIEQSLEYTPKFPKYIVITDSVTTTYDITSKVETPKKIKLLLGGGLGGNNSTFSLSMKAGIRTKDGKDIIYSYNPIIKTHEVGFVIPINF